MFSPVEAIFMAGGRLYEFGDFRLDPSEHLLFRSGKHLPLPPKAVDMLLVLVEHRGHVVDKDTLLKELWPDTFVEEGSLTQNISVLRRVLTEGRDGKALIETIPKRGYRFIAEVKEVAPEIAAGAAGDEPAHAAGAQLPSRRKLLQWAAALGLAALGVTGYFAWHRYFPRSPTAVPRIMLAVLPVQNLSGDPGREYVSDGLTEEMIAQLGSLNPQRLGVIARTSSMAYKSTTKTVDQIARELGVDYVLEASVRESDNRLRVTAQLIRASDQTHVWAHDYDGTLRDLVQLDDDIGRAVAAQIKLELTPETKERLTRSRAANPESFQSYLQGRFYWNRRSKEGFEKGLEFFEEAVHEDPANARAYAGIADSYNIMLFYGLAPGAANILEAKAAAQKSLELDDKLAEGHAALAYVNFMWLWDWPTAEKEFHRAIDLDQNYISAHQWYALYLSSMARHKEAVGEITAAQRLDPLSPIVSSAVAFVHYLGRDFDQAIVESKKALVLDPNLLPAHVVLGKAYEQKGKYAEAIAELQGVVNRPGGDSPAALSYLGHAYAAAGRRREAQEMINRLDNLAKHLPFVGHSNKAVILAGLGERDKAIESLLEAGEQNDAAMIWLRVEPLFDNLRSDARFQEILRRQGKKP